MSTMSGDQIWETDFFQTHLRSALACRAHEAEELLLDLVASNLRLCESPLEAAFLAWWYAYSEHPAYQKLICVPQCDVIANGQAYRLDFVFRPNQFEWFAPLLGQSFLPLVAVEMDGHEFHEKTKEQVTARNRRDRDLQQAGWVILHVSGSEFNHDPATLMKALWRALTEPFHKAMHAHVFARQA